MKSLKTVLAGALIAGLLLVSANGALAAYEFGTYTNEADANLFVNLNADGSFSFPGGDYTVLGQGNFWKATGSSDVIYGAYTSGGQFAFMHFDNDPGPTIERLAKIFLPLVESVVYDPSLSLDVKVEQVSGLIVSTFGFFASMLGNDWFGFGEFTSDTSFNVAVGDLSEDGLKAMLCNNCTETYSKATPIPGAVWLLGSGLVGLVGLRRRMKS